jgi:pilus assembly protein Flp/PilA
MLLNAFVVVVNYLNSLKQEEGQGMVEYVLIIALIALVVVVSFPTLSGAITGVFTSVATDIP